MSSSAIGLKYSIQIIRVAKNQKVIAKFSNRYSGWDENRQVDRVHDGICFGCDVARRIHLSDNHFFLTKEMGYIGGDSWRVCGRDVNDIR